MPSSQPLPEDAQDLLESKAHALVGQLVMVYSRLDVNLALYVANHRGRTAFQQTLQGLNEKSFKEKLDCLIPAVHQAYPGNVRCEAEWTKWKRSADLLRRRRNDLIHGRWGFGRSTGIIENITGLPGTLGTSTVRYTLDSLAKEVQASLEVSYRFGSLAEKWPT